jgi:O-antigen/teichoic acid export membrane protein
MRRFIPDLAAIALLFLLPLIVFWQQTLGGRTLLPTENLYQYEPYATYTGVVKAPPPHNPLLSDLVLQNFQWRSFIRESISRGEIPLWNPYQFSGIPFFAAGQQSTLYPFSILYYVLPLPAAYGWFTVSQLWLAGACMYLLVRGLSIGQLGALLSGITFQLSGFFLASAVFPMMIAAAAWIPLLLLMVELVIRQQSFLRGRPSSVPWVIIGAVALGCNILAGHVEITYYALLISGFYAACRLGWHIFTTEGQRGRGAEDRLNTEAQRTQKEHRGEVTAEGQRGRGAEEDLTQSGKEAKAQRGDVGAPFMAPAAFPTRLRWTVGRGTWLIVMIGLGLGLGAVQFIPLFEFAGLNYRDGRTTYEQVVGWAHPLRDFIQYLLPNFYGNPTHTAYFDWFTMQTVPVTVNAAGDSIRAIDWGIKNYVEGALYVGILPLLLAAYGLVSRIRINHRDTQNTEQTQRVGGQDTSQTAPPPTTDHQPPTTSHRPPATSYQPSAPPYKWIFLALTVLALTFMFGLPTYALLYNFLPGINQLHSPFRWVLAVTLGVAVLAGFGAEALLHPLTPSPTGRGAGVRASWFGWGTLAAGGLLLVALIAGRVFWAQVEPLVESVFRALALAPAAYPDAQAFFSYQFTNGLILALMLIGSGLIFRFAPQRFLPQRHRDHRGSTERNSATSEPSASPANHQPPATSHFVLVTRYSLLILTALDLMLASWGFNPASDPALLDFTPPSIQWLQAQQAEDGPFRYITVDDPTAGERGKLFNANMTWRYGLYDVRGYESIIPKQYVDFMAGAAPQLQLDFNRVSPLYPDRLGEVDWGRLGLLGVRYIITPKTFNLYDSLPLPRDSRSGRELVAPAPVYEDEAVRIWDCPCQPFPRAYLTDVLDGSPGNLVEPTLEMGLGLGWTVVIESDSGRELILHANVSGYNNAVVATSWLTVNQTWLDGWRAFVRPRGGTDSSEQPLPTQLVLGNFLGVNLSPDVVRPLYANAALDPAQAEALANGQLTVRVVYSPVSFQLGLFASFISALVMLFLAGIYLWRLFIARDAVSSGGVQSVARNSAAPIILNLFNRGIDFGFAFIMLRILGPEGAGIYTYAAFIFGWFDIFTNFGLNVYLMREASRDRANAFRLLLNTSTLRILLMLVGVGLLAVFLGLRQTTVNPPLTTEAVFAIVLLYIGLVPNSLSTGLSALYYAFEKAEIPAAIQTVSTICKAVFGVAALALGWGVIGLAAVSILTNIVTLMVLAGNARGLFVQQPAGDPHLTSPEFGGETKNLTPQTLLHSRHAPKTAWRWRGGDERTALERESWRPDWRTMRGMLGEGFPLMLNHFLATIFFQIDVVIIQAIHGDRMVGQYSVAYKWISALNVIPAFFTMALLPAMSRQAQEDRPALKRNYGLAVKLLVSAALPAAVAFTFMAYTLTQLLGGAEFIPDGAIATQLMIWSIPIGWINSLTQYVLIALDLQRRITRAFVIAVSFNILTNLIFIPAYGYRAAALTTIASEGLLLLLWGWMLMQAVGRVDWVRLLWRSVVAAGAMLAVLALGWSIQPFLALVIATLVYGGVLLALRPFDAAEWAILAPIIPSRLRRWIPAPA